MDIVVFETAKRLKEAGFPQPEYIERGFGYDETGSLFTIQECSFPPGGVGGMYYAPTATDILLEIDGAILEFIRFSKQFPNEPDAWFCQNVIVKSNGFFDFEDIGEHPTNPAEAVAAAWLSVNANK
jgi:hypothetical protein